MPNLGALDRIVRLLLGVAMIGYALPRGLQDANWQCLGIAGAFILVTAAFRHCPVYSSIGLSSLRTGRMIKR